MLRSEKRKWDDVTTGGSTDHWPTHVPNIYRGSRYSDDKGISNVILSATEKDGCYDPALLTHPCDFSISMSRARDGCVNMQGAVYFTVLLPNQITLLVDPYEVLCILPYCCLSRSHS